MLSPLTRSRSPFGGAASGAAAPSSPITTILSDGWSATYPNVATEFPALAPSDNVTLTVSRPGFNASGAPVNVSRTIRATKRVRDPGVTALSANRVSLSNFIFSTDIVAGGVTNSSGVLPPQPSGLWLHSDREILRGSNIFTARLVVVHQFARNGRPVAAVEFSATDGTNTVTQMVTSMSVISYSASGRSVPHFAAALDFSTLNQGAEVTVSAKIYPWEGEMFDLAVHADAFPSPNLCTFRVLNDRAGTYGQIFAYVDPVNGNNTTGQASASEATAAGLPFLTYAAALTAVRTENANLNGRNDTSACTIKQTTGTFVLSTQIATQGPTGLWPLTIEAAVPSSRATTIIQQGATNLNTAASIPGRVIFRNITFQRSTSADNVMLNQMSGNLAYTTSLTFDSCLFDRNGFSAGNAYVFRTSLVTTINCEATNGESSGEGNISGTTNKTVKLIGCGPGVVGNAAFNSVGCRVLAGSARAATTARVASAGTIIGWNYASSNVDTQNLNADAPQTTRRGWFMVGNIVERWGPAATPNLSSTELAGLWADGNVNEARYICVMDNTLLGERTNFIYQDTGTSTVLKTGYFTNTIVREFNIKSDLFPTINANRTGNWSGVHHVETEGLVAIFGSNNTDVPGPNNWIGEVAPPNSALGSNASPIVCSFVNDQSEAAGTGNGDYRVLAASALPRILAGQAHFSHDQLGRPIPNDGSGFVGALAAPV